MKHLTLLLSIIIIFLSISIIYSETSISETSIKNIKNESNCNSKDKINYPIARTIVLRMDDVEGHSSNIIMNLTDTILEKNMSVTLGVIPHPDRKKEEDKIIFDYLLSKINDSRIEIAQHGTNHSVHELINLSESDTYNVTKLGFEKLSRILGKKPITYITPYNEYNSHTTNALSRLGFKILSSDWGEYEFDGNMMHVGFDTSTKYSNSEELDREGLVPVNTVLNNCERYLKKNNLCVIMIHPKDYIGKNGNIDPDKYKEFVELLSGLKNLNVRFETFRDLRKNWII